MGLAVAAVLVMGPSGATGRTVPQVSATTAQPTVPRASTGTAQPTVPRASPHTPQPSLPSSLRVLALGDSVTAGTTCGCVPFPQLYGTALERKSHVPARITNDGVNGATSADILAGLTPERAVIAAADVVVVTVGANDFIPVSDSVLSGSCGGEHDLGCTQGTLDRLQRNLTSTVIRIRALHGSGPVTVLLTGYWNVFEDGNVADSDYSDAGRAGSIALTTAVDDVVDSVAVATQATYVDLFTPFKGAGGDRDATPLLADDGDHPDAAGHRVIARALLSRTDVSTVLREAAATGPATTGAPGSPSTRTGAARSAGPR